jgi:putative tricarboxylic transport membrane protein
LVVHAAAGGGSDIFARTLAAGFEKDKLLPQPVVVENRPGGGGAIAFAYVAGKKGDPHFLVTSLVTLLTTPLTGKSPVSYKDLTPIANFAFDDGVVIVNAKSKYKSIQAVIEDARANPKKITVGGTHAGGPDTISTYLIEKGAGVKFNFVPFNSGGEVNAALLGSHVDLAIANPGEAIELVKAGKIRILGVLAEKRLTEASDIPTLKEQGINAVVLIFRGLCAPKGIPEDARKILEEALFKYTKTETFKKYIKQNMLSEGWMDGPTFGKFLDEWNGRYAVMLKELGLIKK